MKIFKNIDEKFKEIGFIKVKDDEYAVTYERINNIFGYTQVIDILHKKSGRHIIQSYDKHLMDEDKVAKLFNTTGENIRQVLIRNNIERVE